MNAFATQLRVMRLENGLSMSQLARSVNVNPSAISRLESGTRIPSRELVMRISQRLDLDGVPTLMIAAGYLPGNPELLNGSMEHSAIAIQLIMSRAQHSDALPW